MPNTTPVNLISVSARAILHPTPFPSSSFQANPPNCVSITLIMSLSVCASSPDQNLWLYLIRLPLIYSQPELAPSSIQSPFLAPVFHPILCLAYLWILLRPLSRGGWSPDPGCLGILLTRPNTSMFIMRNINQLMLHWHRMLRNSFAVRVSQRFSAIFHSYQNRINLHSYENIPLLVLTFLSPFSADVVNNRLQTPFIYSGVLWNHCGINK